MAPRPAVISPPAQQYKVVPVVGGGTITGTVDFEGTPPAPDVVQPSVDQKVCGNSVVQKKFSLTGTHVGGAVVWLTDIRSGKDFSLVRRFDLTNDSCTFDPYVQVIPTNSTVNVGNDDRAIQTNRFINVGTGLVVAVAPFNDDGEVVPIDRFPAPAEIEVLSVEHPWAHAWLAVLDHPYYAQTATNGTFSIDDVPAGRYRIRAWHPGLGFTDDSVTVTAGVKATVALRIQPGSADVPTPGLVAPEAARPAASSTTPAVPILPTSPAPASSSTPTTTGPPPPKE